MNPILYIVLNGELNMSAGKASAQAVHAAMMLQNNFGGNFTGSYKRTVVVLEAKNSEQIKNLHEYLRVAEVFSDYYIDEGKNEVDAYSITALAVEPIAHDDKELREIFESFPLFGDDYDEAEDSTRLIYNGLQQMTAELRAARLSTPTQKTKRDKWYKRIFKYKQTGFVS